MLALSLWISLANGSALEDYHDGLEALHEQQFTEAAKWFEAAAGQGLAEAQLQLGALYHKGLGVPQDYAQAIDWFTKAARQGHTEAQLNLGYIYDKGVGVEQDYKKAVNWYRKAAEQGDANAQFNLGMMYYDGSGVVQDYVEAHRWLNIAASNGHTDARFSREHTEKHMTDTQIAEAQKRASEWQAEFDRKTGQQPP